MYRAQKSVWKMIRRQRTNMNEFLEVENLAKEQGIEKFSNLYTVNEHEENSTRNSKINTEVEISEEINEPRKHVMNNKKPSRRRIQ